MITNERLEALREWLDEAAKKRGVEEPPDGTNGDYWASELSDAISELLSRRLDASERRYAPKETK